MGQYNLKSILNYIKFDDILSVFKCFLAAPFAFIAKIFVRGFWLVAEEENEARDNGYAFFKWTRENRPNQKIAYAINKKSPDYAKVKGLSKVVSYGTLAHWFWYIVADKNISSQKGGKPNAAVCYLFEVVLKFRKNNRVFLQHGVIKDVLDWLYYKNTYMRLFVTSSIDEFEFVRDTFGYPEGYVQMLGLPRFDALHDINIDSDTVLVMPTWRNWFARESHDNKDLDFLSTEYYKKWSEFLGDQRLSAMLREYGKKLIFFPHRNMQKYLSSFKSADGNIIIADWRDYDIQDALKSAALMITDYSSVFFDFAYMRKPVLFYQFDEKEFRSRQYAQGYFDYHDTPLGKWTDNLDELLNMLEENFKCGIGRVDEEIIRGIFPLYDDKNSERVFNAVKAIESRKPTNI